MFYSRRKLKEIELGNVTLCIKPYDCYQQIEYLEMANETITNKKALPKLCVWCLENVIVDIKGLTDDEGEPIDYASFDKTELVAGFTIGYINAIIDKVYEACHVSEDIKKKS